MNTRLEKIMKNKSRTLKASFRPLATRAGVSLLALITFTLIALSLWPARQLAGSATPTATCNSDDIFVGNFSAGTVVRFSKADIHIHGNASASTVIASGLGTVEGMTLDFDGSVIATTRFANTVNRLDRTGSPNCLIATITTAEGPSFDAAGNLFVNDTGTSTAATTYKAAPVGGCPSMLSPVAWVNTYPANTFLEDTRISPSTAPSFPSALYILGAFGGATVNPTSIQAWSSTTANTMLGTVITDFGTAAGIGIDAYQSLGMAFDSLGNIWLSDFSQNAASGRLLEFNAAGVFQRMVTIPGSSQSQGKIAISAGSPTDPLNPNKDTIFVADSGNKALYIVDAVTGNVLNTLTSNLSGRVGPVGVAVCDVIVKPPPTTIVGVSVSPGTIDENQHPQATFTISTSQPVSQDVTVHYAMSGTADIPVDYVLINGNNGNNGKHGHVIITAGHSSASVTLHSFEEKDDHSEPRSETAKMTLVNGTGYTVGSNNSATVTIRD
jgi:hypothetical protein